MKINSYSVPTIVVNNKITGDRVGCVLFSYEDLLSEVINDYYAKGGQKEMTFLHVHDGGRLLAHCEKSFVDAHVLIRSRNRMKDGPITHPFFLFEEPFAGDFIEQR